MQCLQCKSEIDKDDKFCYNCGHWTAKGYTFLKDYNNRKLILKGNEFIQRKKFLTLLTIASLMILLFFGAVIFRGNEMFKPVIYLKKQVTNAIYGYNTSIIKADNLYNNIEVANIEEAYNLISKDFDSQTWKCYNNIELSRLEFNFTKNFGIASVTFCDISYDLASELSGVITEMYNLFPNIKGGLTNITISNFKNENNNLAYFQPKYQFINSSNSIVEYNKVNKTQILLNSYYFLNDGYLNANIVDIVGKNWYVKDASWSSIVAHEVGHYISFKTLLKTYNIDNITLETKENTEFINNIITSYEKGNFSKLIVEEALINYNTINNSNMDIDSFAKLISNYAAVKNENDEIIYDETIAEAIHDYYLHKENCSRASYEIVKIILDKLGV